MFPSRGQCLCGRVTVLAKEPPVRMAQCHCRDCQRVSGTGHTTNALFRSGDVELVGATGCYSVTADSGNTFTRHFCSSCGSRVYAFNSGRQGMTIVSAGIFDDSGWFRPEVVLYTRRRCIWDPEVAGVPAFERMPPPPKPQIE